ncbi:MAG: patatin-like phospholipase family protein, partial [Pseudomonadales bacterium]|nr:patatin-like phospholipase family protein [Pseudomonadales bacterium]
DLPFGLRRVLKAMGASTKGGGGSLASYVLFEAAFCRELITCGYEDAMRDHIAVKDFFGLSE